MARVRCACRADGDPGSYRQHITEGCFGSSDLEQPPEEPTPKFITVEYIARSTFVSINLIPFQKQGDQHEHQW
jgi:hypothetical protein